MHTTAHIIQSLVLYAVAEHQAGHARRLWVELDGGAFVVADDGRGHAIDKSVDGTPYLQLIYEQLQYPFALDQPGAVQLHGIGISLVNALCCELEVWVHKAHGGLHLRFAQGRLVAHERLPGPFTDTGNRLRGRVHPALQPTGTDLQQLTSWLRALQRATPGLTIHVNGAALERDASPPHPAELR